MTLLTRRVFAGTAAGLAAWSTWANSPAPAAPRPDLLMSGVTTE